MHGQRLRVVLAMLSVVAGCSPSGGLPDGGAVDEQNDAAAGGDAGHDEPADAGVDGGTDGGADGGVDGGVDAGIFALPTLEGWEFYGRQHGGPQEVMGVSMDEGGNVWVAGGAEGLFLLEPGATRFRRFTAGDGLASYVGLFGPTVYDVISVAGGPAGTVFVGYRGLFGPHEEQDPPELLRSGDADRVTLQAGGLAVTHFDISSPPGPDYPNGRDKIRSVLRIVYDGATGDVWFGGNHGVAMWSQRYGRVFEHQHATITGYTASGTYLFMSGDWYGLVLTPSGDVWMGGGHRVGRLNYATGGGFWASIEPTLDIWPDAVPRDARADQRTDDLVQDLALGPGGELWVGSMANGLAEVTSGGTLFFRDGPLYRAVTSLEVDPAGGSVWVGHLYGGLTRLVGGQRIYLDRQMLGGALVERSVPDIQSKVRGGRRYILVAFRRGAVGIYTGR